MSWETATEEAALALDVWPLDEHNVKLLDAVHPRSWADPAPDADVVYDLIAIGAGAGGLVSAKQSARRGARSAMISEHLAGGDCLNVGCVPSKALLRCARAASEVRRAAEFGLVLPEGAAPRVDFGRVMERMRKLRAKISDADSHDGTNAAGADVFQGRGRFVGPNEIEVNGQRLRFRKAVIATGGRAAVPPNIPGLASVPYRTNATLFNLTELPRRMVVLGAGPIGLEMAQAFAAFGSEVTCVQRCERILSRNDADAAAALQACLERDGIRFIVSAEVLNVATSAAAVAASAGAPSGEIELQVRSAAGGSERLVCDVLLVATGRTPNVDDLGLEAAGVQSVADGVRVNDLLQSTNPDVYAVGDCVAGVGRFTHLSGEMAKMAVQNALFGDSWRLSSLVLPAVTYTEPELASVGDAAVAAAAAAADGKGEGEGEGEGALDTYTTPLAHNDRAILEGDADDGSFVRVHCRRGTDTIVAATVLAPRAGEIISELTLAIQEGIGLGRVARVIHPYPTTAEAVMGCGLQYIRKHWQKMPPR